MEMIRTQSFGSTNVAVLKSNALKQGSVLIEVWFKDLHEAEPDRDRRLLSYLLRLKPNLALAFGRLV
jgi:hypothetical protein